MHEGVGNAWSHATAMYVITHVQRCGIHAGEHIHVDHQSTVGADASVDGLLAIANT